MKEELVAPCGMNCNICAAYQAVTHDVRSKGIRMSYCTGCRPRDKQCAFLKKKCDLLRKNKVQYCHECKRFPCKPLSRIDARYKDQFRMSMIENLQHIRDEGVGSFLKAEENKWRCPECGGTICCHNGICFDCGISRLKAKKRVYRWSDEPD